MGDPGEGRVEAMMPLLEGTWCSRWKRQHVVRYRHGRAAQQGRH